MPKVSVVIPVYQRPTTLPRAIRSVLAQTEQDFEIIIVDDGSPTPVADQLNDPDPRIRCLRLPVNGGPANARNHGVAQARADIIAFLDSDDEWLPEKLAIQLALLEAPDKPFVYRAVASAFRMERADGPATQSVRYPKDLPKDSPRIVWGCDVSPGSTLMVRKEVFAEIGEFRSDMRRLEDWEWLIRLVSHEGVRVASEPLAIIHFSASPNYWHIRAACDLILKLHGDDMRQRDLRAYRKFWSTMELEKAVWALRAGFISRALLHGAACLLAWPLRNREFWQRVTYFLLGRGGLGRHWAL